MATAEKPKESPPAPKEPIQERTPTETKPEVKADTDNAKKPLKVDATKTDIIKSIQDNSNIDAKTKAQILSELQSEEQTTIPIVSKALEPKRADADITIDLTPRKNDPTKTTTTVPSNFDMLDIFNKKIPGVKADTDNTPQTNPFLPIDPKNGQLPQPPANGKVPPPAPKNNTIPQANRKESFLLMPIGQNDTDPTYEMPNTDIGVTVGNKVDYSTTWDVGKAVPNGKLLQFWVKPIAKRPEKLRSVAYNWMVLPREDYLTWPDTTRVVLSSGTKTQTYVVILTASYVFLDGENVIQKTAQAITMVQVGEGNSGIPTSPNLTGLAKSSYEWTSTVIRAGAYDDTKVKADAKKLADAFLKTADRIKTGELADANAIIAATKAENDASIENRNEWLPWFTRMSEALRQGYSDQTIKTPEQFQAAWREIARGLQAAGN